MKTSDTTSSNTDESEGPI